MSVVGFMQTMYRKKIYTFFDLTLKFPTKPGSHGIVKQNRNESSSKERKPR